jgi:hypothetical protein
MWDRIETLSISDLRLANHVKRLWDGEDDEFAVTRLDGFQRCTRIARLDMTDCYIDNLEPLLLLPALRTLALSWRADFELSASGWKRFKRRNDAVSATLRDRGVDVTCEWPPRPRS